MKLNIVAIGLLLVLAMANAQAGQPPRIDASSNATAVSSWNVMLNSVSPTEKQKLLEAMLKINLAGVQSAKELVNNPSVDHLGIVRIKDKVAGLTADQIIKLGDQVSTVTIKSSGQ